MPLKLPSLIGHRGACGYAPENTLESIKTAADLGVEWVELDVKLTKDQFPIIFHDDDLDRTSNGHGPVAQATWEEIQHLEAGSWFSDGFSGAKIPSLEETLELLIDLKLGLNLEIKPCPGREIETAEVALDMLSRIWDDHDRLLISSFSHVSLETAHDMAHDWARGLLLEEEWPPNWKDLAEYLHVTTVNIDGNACTREQVEDIIDAGYPIAAYTINDPPRARLLRSWGVDCLFSDVPDVIAENMIKVH